MKKLIIIGLSLFGLFGILNAQEIKYQLSSHILDISKGEPAPNVRITLSKQKDDNSWLIIDDKITDENGRIKDFLPITDTNESTNKGIYKLTYHIAPYFEHVKMETFYPYIEVVFEIKDNSHYHVPITLSPFGYSTYRGN